MSHELVAELRHLSRMAAILDSEEKRDFFLRTADAMDGLLVERAKLLSNLEQARTLVATAEKWRGLATAKFGDGRTVQEIQREAAEAEREACLRCYSPDDTADDWADKIRARGES